MERRGKNDIFFQWYGNKPLAEANKPFAPGWVRSDNKGYYAIRKLHASHPPWTNMDTATCVGEESSIVKGKDIINPRRIGVIYREKIETALGEKIDWGGT